MKKSNIVKVLTQLKSNINDYKYCFDFNENLVKGCLHFKVKINKENKLILISKFSSNKLTFNLDNTLEEDLKFKDYQVIKEIYQNINKKFNKSEIILEILMKKEFDPDGYDFNKTIEFYDEDKLEYYIQDTVNLDDNLKEMILSDGKEELNIYFNFSFKRDESQIELHPASLESFNILSLIISKSNKLNEYFRNIIKMFNTYPSVFEISLNDDLNEYRNIVRLIKEDIKSINNNFCSGKYTDKYSYISITSNFFNNNLYASIGNHIEGYDINLVDRSKPKVFYPTVYTYKDLLRGNLLDYTKDIYSFQRDKSLVPLNLSNQDLLVTDLYMLLKDSFVSNINYFKYTKNRNYINFHLILTKGKIIKIEKLTNGFIGTNKDNDVILKVYGTTFDKIISSEDLFLNKINSLL